MGVVLSTPLTEYFITEWVPERLDGLWDTRELWTRSVPVSLVFVFYSSEGISVFLASGGEDSSVHVRR